MFSYGSCESLRIGIVGSNGYLAGELIQIIQRENIDIFPLGREFLIQDTFPDLDVVIDSGFPRDIHKENVRFEYFKHLAARLEYCKTNKVNYLYFGSLSSHSPVASKYGSAKREAENLVLSMKGKVIRFGLVVNTQEPGGRYKELIDNLRKLPIIFVPNPGFFPVGVTRIEEFLEALDRIIFQSESLVYDQTAPIDWTNLNLLVRNSTNKKVFELPKFVTKVVCRMIRWLPLGKIDNLKAIAYEIL